MRLGAFQEMVKKVRAAVNREMDNLEDFLNEKLTQIILNEVPKARNCRNLRHELLVVAREEFFKG